MKNRITQLFKRKDKEILSIYFTAGYPNLDNTTTILTHLEQAGVDLVEIGIPYSDPLADGPTIQKSGQIALDNGMTLQILFEQLKNIRETVQIPIVLMGYLNPILQYGVNNFLQQCAVLGVDGIIVPDLPMEYYKQHFEEACHTLNISNIMLISNETSQERIRQIDQCTTGFIYMVSSNSITGANKDLNTQTDYYSRIQQNKLNNPTLIGFNIHNNDTYKLSCQYSSGAIIGSAFVKHITANGIAQNSINNFTNQIKNNN
ncbi:MULTISPECIES: tryptophan synthase subunit alpha [Myroides]|uniref:Tryptophan synthase alpha chain n=1 Tax=Myroides albus TaxID=2562892 RepID=A0A6I3LFL1_9FLAO|nr:MULTISPECIES: tryptophan synthase subunit alpha [Myroides]MTG96697.1 tryptophan synthase subunit alpha [Myroides albus]MVX34709.1 tryptophan synthase subunit alpha [Myroides sp. LoEW2-1]UVD80891.1 tryptophan synthase subunit alpha [Myroides albus]